MDWGFQIAFAKCKLQEKSQLVFGRGIEYSRQILTGKEFEKRDRNREVGNRDCEKCDPIDVESVNDDSRGIQKRLIFRRSFCEGGIIFR